MPYVNGAPEIQSFEDMISEDEFSELIGASRSTVVAWRYGRKSIPLPYVRIGSRVFISKTQAIWWINQLQKAVDPKHAQFAQHLEKGTKVGRRE